MPTTEQIIDRVVELCLTHIEHHSQHQEPGAVKVTADSNYWMTLRPDRTAPGELLPASAEHRRSRIAAWQKLVRRAVLEDDAEFRDNGSGGAGGTVGNPGVAGTEFDGSHGCGGGGGPNNGGVYAPDTLPEVFFGGARGGGMSAT